MMNEVELTYLVLAIVLMLIVTFVLTKSGSRRR
jgi:hypothetical protein